MPEPDPNKDNLDNSETSWKDGVHEDHRELINRFAEPADLAKGYFELNNKMSSSEKTNLRIPKEGASDEVQDEFWSKVGMPKDADSYNITVPDGVPQNEEFIKSVKQIARKARATQSQFDVFVEGYTGLQMAELQRVDKLNEDRWTKFKSEWGEDTTKENINLAKQAFDEIAPEELKALMTRDDVEKDPLLVKMYSNVWRRTLDDSLVKGSTPAKPPEKKQVYEKEFHEKYPSKDNS